MPRFKVYNYDQNAAVLNYQPHRQSFSLLLYRMTPRCQALLIDVLNVQTSVADVNFGDER
ncbi:hypothetical protein CLM76_09660 [Vreelandella venusta]|nr:hypothetical protein CLM76_09660 [Halomonas hydrothermalis]